MPQDGHPRRVSLVFRSFSLLSGLSFSSTTGVQPSILADSRDLLAAHPYLHRSRQDLDTTYRSRNPNAPPGVSIGATFGALAFVIVLVFLLWHGRSFSRRHGFYSGSQHTVQTVDLQGAKSAQAKLDLDAGQLIINGGASHMLDADFTYSNSFDAPRVDYHVDGGVGQLHISQNPHSVHFGPSQNDWNLHFSKDIPLELKVDMGAGRGIFIFATFHSPAWISILAPARWMSTSPGTAKRFDRRH